VAALRLPESQGKPDQDRQHNPQEYEEDNDNGNDYRSESFHHFLYPDYVIYLEPTGTAGAVSVGWAGIAAIGYECWVLETVTAWSGVDPLHSVLRADLAGQLPAAEGAPICGRRPGTARSRLCQASQPTW
jgi:hypothetical protein